MRKILDHGYVKLAGVFGTDADIDAAARTSYASDAQEARTRDQQRNLIRYLMRHRHSSPFEMPVLRFQLKMPIFVARQWVRHRTASMNEVSGRYTALPNETYTPPPERIRGQSASNKQGSDSEVLASAVTISNEFELEAQAVFAGYEGKLKAGVSREVARTNLPLSTYTTFVWQCNLRNLLHFLGLRTDPHAQEEIRVYADAIAEIVAEHFPLTWEAWCDYVRDAVTFTRPELALLRDALSSVDMRGVGLGLSHREVAEFRAKVEGVLVDA